MRANYKIYKPIIIKSIIILLVIVIFFVIFMISQWNSYKKDFNNSEQIIDKELSALDIPGISPKSSFDNKYEHGVCFDNCPQKHYYFQLKPDTNVDQFNKDTSKHLLNQGYMVSLKNPIGANKETDTDLFILKFNINEKTKVLDLTVEHEPLY